MALFKVISLLGALAVIALAVPVSGVEESYSHIAVEAAALPPAPALHISHAPLAIAHAPVIKEVEHHAPPQYEFRYGVKDDHTHDIKEQAEKRVGDKVEGHYSLVEPDGTTRTVKYTADHHSGFNAVVTKSGHAVHPATPPQKVVAAPVISYAHVPLTTHEAAVSYDHDAELIYH